MAAAEKDTAKTGFVSKIRRFFRDMKGEIKKVVWPSRKQVVNNTVVVIVFVVIASIFIGGFDLILSALIKAIFKM